MWILREWQACPRGLSLCRRETGCSHLHCRCGCDFCFTCGGPYEGNGCMCNKYRDLALAQQMGACSFGRWLESNPLKHPKVFINRAELALARLDAQASAVGLELGVFLFAELVDVEYDEHASYMVEAQEVQDMYGFQPWWKSWVRTTAVEDASARMEAMVDAFVEHD